MDETQLNITPVPEMTPEKKSAGPLIGIIIIIAILIVGGYLIYSRSITKVLQPITPASDQSTAQNDATILEDIRTQSSSDSPDDISADLKKVSPNDLDKGMETL